MRRNNDWYLDEFLIDLDEWEEWEEVEQDEPDEEWEEEYYRSYREQFPEEFEDEQDDEELSSEEVVKDYIRNLMIRITSPGRYADEPIAPRRSKEPLPQLLQTARALESEMRRPYQNRNALFLKQAKLLEHYEDDYPRQCCPTLYYPTYENLTDSELRSYFAFRTRLRRGEEPEGCSSFVFLYMYELINGIGAETPQAGLEKLDRLAEECTRIDTSIEYYWRQWRQDYIVYYDLPPELNRTTKEDSAQQLDQAETMSTEQVVEAMNSLPSVASWLRRSKCYAGHRAQFDRVLADTIRGMCQHCRGKSRSFCDRYLGTMRKEPVRLFSSAIFADPLKRKTGEYYFSPWYFYSVEHGLWFVHRRRITESGGRKLLDLVKSVDNALRVQFDPKHLIQTSEQPKWINTLIQTSIQTLLEEQAARQREQAAQKREQERLKIDYSALERIRTDAAITQEKLLVEEEREEELPEELPQPAPEPEQNPAAQTPMEQTAPDCPLNAQEYRLMQCLLYGKSTQWIQQEGLMESILLDSINEKLYDIFQDTVIEDDRIVEDYIDELKEMIAP